jgi:hypothetical protein
MAAQLPVVYTLVRTVSQPWMWLNKLSSVIFIH